MDAEGADPCLDRLLVERVYELLVIEAPRVLRLGRQRVADRIELPTVRMQLVDRVIDLVHPARLPRRNEGVGEHSGAVAAYSIDHVSRLADLIVLQELPRVVIE